MAMTPEAVVDRVQVNIPFPFLINGYLARFLDKGLNPEIGLDAWSLGTYPPKIFRRIARIFTQAVCDHLVCQERIEDMGENM